MPGIFEATSPMGSGYQTLDTDPPSGFTVYGDSGDWPVHTAQIPDPSNEEIDQSVERNYTGSSNSHLLWNDGDPTYVESNNYSFKALLKISTTPTGQLVLCILPDYSVQNHGYGIALRPNTGHFDIVKVTDYGSLTNLQTSEFTFDSDTWYVVHFKMSVTDLKASIWEWGDAEPSWMVETSDATYEYGTTAASSLASLGSVNANIGFVSFKTHSTANAADPPVLDLDLTGDGSIDFEDFFVEGNPSVGNSDIDFPYFTVNSNYIGQIDFAFPDFDIYGGYESKIDGDVDFETFDIAGQGGGNALLVFPEPTVNASGHIWKEGNGAVEYGLDDDDIEINSYGNYCGMVDFSDVEVEATGITGSVGDAEVDFRFSVSGTGLTEICTVGECGVFFPLASILAGGKLEILGRGSLDFPLSAILGSGLLSILGNGELPFPPATISGSGSVLPLGDGELFFEFDVQGFGESEESSSILRYKQYGYD